MTVKYTIRLALLFCATVVFAGVQANPLDPDYQWSRYDRGRGGHSDGGHPGGQGGNVGANARSNAEAVATVNSTVRTYATGGSGGEGGRGGAGGAGGNATGGSSNQWQSVDGSGNSTVSNAGNSTVSNAGNSSNTNSTANDNSNSSNNSSNVNIHQNYEAKRNPVSTAYAPALTSGIDTCLGSFSAGAQHTVFGISLGKTTIDENCVMLKQARMLHEMGLRVSAWQRLCQAKETRQALLDSGEYDCKSTASQLAQVAFDKDKAIREEQQRLADAETLKQAERVLLEKKIRDEIDATKPRAREFGTPTYTEPHVCKKSKSRPKKRSTTPPCK